MPKVTSRVNTVEQLRDGLNLLKTERPYGKKKGNGETEIYCSAKKPTLLRRIFENRRQDGNQKIRDVFASEIEAIKVPVEAMRLETSDVRRAWIRDDHYLKFEAAKKLIVRIDNKPNVKLNSFEVRRIAADLSAYKVRLSEANTAFINTFDATPTIAIKKVGLGISKQTPARENTVSGRLVQDDRKLSGGSPAEKKTVNLSASQSDPEWDEIDSLLADLSDGIGAQAKPSLPAQTEGGRTLYAKSDAPENMLSTKGRRQSSVLPRAVSVQSDASPGKKIAPGTRTLAGVRRRQIQVPANSASNILVRPSAPTTVRSSASVRLASGE